MRTLRSLRKSTCLPLAHPLRQTARNRPSVDRCIAGRKYPRHWSLNIIAEMSLILAPRCAFSRVDVLPQHQRFDGVVSRQVHGSWWATLCWARNGFYGRTPRAWSHSRSYSLSRSWLVLFFFYHKRQAAILAPSGSRHRGATLYFPELCYCDRHPSVPLNPVSSISIRRRLHTPCLERVEAKTMPTMPIARVD